MTDRHCEIRYEIRHEILIVGGGPVGLLTAALLAQKNFAVTVCERKSFPVDKACGEGILQAGVTILKQLGLVPTKHSIISGLTFRSFGKTFSIPFEQSALGVRRTELSAKLYDLCNSLGVSFLDQTRFRMLERLENRTNTTFLTKDGKLFCKLFDYVIGCDGIHSKIARIHDAELQSLPFSQRSGMRRHFRGSPWTRNVEIYFFEGGEVYVTPVGPSEIQVAVLAFRGRYRAFDDVIHHLPELAWKLREFTPVEDHLAHGPLGWFVKKPVQESYAVLGDAFCFWDGISGEGLSLGFKEAILFSQNFSLPLSTSVQTSLNRELRRTIRPYLVVTFLLLLLSRYSFLRRVVLSVLVTFPRFGARIGHRIVTFGNGSPVHL